MFRYFISHQYNCEILFMAYYGAEFRLDPMYRKYYLADEPYFLRDMGYQFGLNCHPSDPLVFISRFQDDHLDLKPAEIVQIIEPKLKPIFLTRFNDIEISSQDELLEKLTSHYKDRLYKGIRPKLKKRGFLFNKEEQIVTEWVAGTRWLFQQFYPRWREPQRSVTPNQQAVKPNLQDFKARANGGIISEVSNYTVNPIQEQNIEEILEIAHSLDKEGLSKLPDLYIEKILQNLRKVKQKIIQKE
jgi:hypothetical protein